MKLIAVSQRVDPYPDRSECRDALDQKLVRLLVVAGYLAVPVPNAFMLQCAEYNQYRFFLAKWLDAIKPHGFMLTGGNDLGACPERDMTEYRLLDYAEQHRLPVLGICRGMQIMGVKSGVSLQQVSGHAGTRHMLTGHFAGEFNSYHSYALAECPEGFEVLARAEDGNIEAMRHCDFPWQGWMWHPEREEPFLSCDIERFKDLFS